jgi:hypothetical protein
MSAGTPFQFHQGFEMACLGFVFSMQKGVCPARLTWRGEDRPPGCKELF